MISVAAVVSTTGPILTFVALNLQKETEEPKKRKFSLALRIMLLDLRKRLRNPKIITKTKEIEVEKEIIKEIPIEKIVYKEVVKPEPVEIPVFVQVPVPTDPKDLPKMDELTPEDMQPISSNGGIN